MKNPYATEVKLLFLAQAIVGLGGFFKGNIGGALFSASALISIPIIVVSLISLCRSRHIQTRKGKTSGVVGLLIEIPVLCIHIKGVVMALDEMKVAEEICIPVIVCAVSPLIVILGITCAIYGNERQKRNGCKDGAKDAEDNENDGGYQFKRLPTVIAVIGVILMLGSDVWCVVDDNNHRDTGGAAESYTTEQNGRDYQHIVTDPLFTNKYGTRDTLCAHLGCTNYIASSGDTNCCTVHSNKCYECGCYIDEDASWCVDCLTKAAKQAQQDKTRYCEECGSTADYSIIGITGNKEYYCYKHYKEMQELMKWMLEN